ncbi:D-alanyl-D-alanine carboxypeptidase / D-alanyl-D-alanine-endopeptidase (penicillin-binding protein 4) [Pseudonocardia thermophila]|uniref:D-alanyl-D-alanine carboxypeptidase / D-alanyl-D-alanine-endopeptidase (Penicillin-binding protein 4) n=1 Tax=Pseudonocardia thermophila TaxID=1848 RepID=A0A1M6UKS6_PSETH|nr:D-alanyl-D-alanine carboxypeptidase / D-alanyl-D-alanine-endopeptidase (penicillin-binding protein 4) [Pseudonocardia thermophila]
MGLGRTIGDTARVPGRGLRRLAIVLVVLIGAAALGGTVALGAPTVVAKLTGSSTIEAPPPPKLTLVGLPETAPMPSAAALAKQLEKPLDAIPGKVTGIVRDAVTGEVLWDHTSDRALVPGSTGKLLTAAAALLTLDSTRGLVTKVVAGKQPGTVVLVGGGDPTLTALPEGKETVYPQPTRLVELARKVKATVKEPITRVQIDVSRYQGDRMAPGWDPADIQGGYIAPIQPLMLDGGRLDPTEQDGARTPAPARAAGQAFAELLGVDGRQITETVAEPGAKVLAAVTSAPISELVEHTLRVSDNVLAEVLAHEVARARGATPDFPSASREILAALNQAGIDTTGTQLYDGSGLSTKDRVSSRVLGAVLAAAAAPTENPNDPQFLRPLITGLPVAGGDGTLATRFGPGERSADGRGVVRAKTGTLTDVSSLAGVVTDADGRLLVFALMSNGGSPAAVRPRLDDLAAALAECGCRA